MSVFSKIHFHKLSATAITWILIAVILLGGTFGVTVIRPDVGYRIAGALRPYRPIALTETDPGECTPISLADFCFLYPEALNNNLLLVNSTHPLPETVVLPACAGEESAESDALVYGMFAQPMTEFNGVSFAPGLEEAYLRMRSETEEKTGDHLVIVSAYRTAEEQREALESKGEALAAQPGFSEHQTGLSLDVAVRGFGGMSFLKTAGGRSVGSRCAEYGFIVRYPYGKEKITGYAYEPWHLRYVGEPHARLMAKSGLSLEEYLDFLTPGVWFTDGEYLISRQSGSSLSIPEGASELSLSYDNTGYLILTVRK